MTSSAAHAPDPSKVPTVSLKEIVETIRERRAIILDVLSPESFAGQHLPGAINLPVAEIPLRAAEVLPDRHAPIVTYCGGPT